MEENNPLLPQRGRGAGCPQQSNVSEVVVVKSRKRKLLSLFLSGQME